MELLSRGIHRVNPKEIDESVLTSLGFKRGQIIHLVGVSGGKDSLVVLEKVLKEIQPEGFVVPFFHETKWEHPLTYKTLERIEEFYGIGILVLDSDGIEKLIRKYKIFPSWRKRFCTRQCKIFPFKSFLRALEKLSPSKVVIWLGKRRDESKARANTQEVEIFEPREETTWGRYSFAIEIRNPLAFITEGEVWEIIRKRGLPVNPLYQQGFNRVGCFPCLISEASIRRVCQLALEGDPYAKEVWEKLKSLERELGKSITHDKTTKDIERKVRKAIKQLPLFGG